MPDLPPVTAPEAADAAALLNALLPGDGLFPPAGELGIADLVERRLETTAPGQYARFLAALAADGPPAALPPPVLHDKLVALETASPDLFATVLSAIYLCYYETDRVHAAINAMGKRYNAHPQPDGYPLPAFRAGDAPQGQTGWYKGTTKVKRGPVPAGLSGD